MVQAGQHGRLLAEVAAEADDRSLPDLFGFFDQLFKALAGLIAAAIVNDDQIEVDRELMWLLKRLDCCI